jgi:pilus assembly protein Flp/PilA
MLTVMKQFQMWLQVRRGDEGATAVEYGLMIALIAGAIVVVVALLGDHLSTLFTNVDTKVQKGVTDSTG